MLLNVTYLNVKMKSLECVLTSGGGITQTNPPKRATNTQPRKGYDDGGDG